MGSGTVARARRPAALETARRQLVTARASDAKQRARFYRATTPAGLSEDAARVLPTGSWPEFCGASNFFFLEADKWLEEPGVDPMQPSTARFVTAVGFTSPGGYQGRGGECRWEDA